MKFEVCNCSIYSRQYVETFPTVCCAEYRGTVFKRLSPSLSDKDKEEAMETSSSEQEKDKEEKAASEEGEDKRKKLEHDIEEGNIATAAAAALASAATKAKVSPQEC